MREFGSLAAFAGHIAGLVAATEHATHEALEAGAKIVETEAKRVIGTYDYGWPPLKPATVARKAKGDTPLLETGEMRASIGRKIGHGEAVVGSDNDKAVWHELGTSKTPPRPFLSGAAAAKEAEVQAIMGKKFVARIVQG